MDGKTLLAIPVLIVKLPFLALKYIFTHKILLILFVAVIVLLIVFKPFGHKTPAGQVEVPKYQQLMPGVIDAPRIVQTQSRFYPYSTFQETKQYLILTDYYSYDSKKWIHCTEPYAIDKKYIVKTYTRNTGS